MQDRQALGPITVQKISGSSAVRAFCPASSAGPGRSKKRCRVGLRNEQEDPARIAASGAGRDEGVILLAQQVLIPGGRQPLVDHRVEFVQRMNSSACDEDEARGRSAAQLFAADPRVALEEAGDQRRQGEDVERTLFAVVGRQHRVLFVEIEDAAQRVASARFMLFTYSIGGLAVAVGLRGRAGQ